MMGAYLLSLIGGMAIGYIRPKLKDVLFWSAIIIFVTIGVTISIDYFVHVSHPFEPKTYLVSRINQLHIEQLLLGFLLGVLIGRGFRFYYNPRSRKLKPVDRTLIYPVAALVLLGLILPIVPAFLARVKEVSLPFASLAFSQQEAQTQVPTSARDSKNEQFDPPANRRSSTKLLALLANQKRDQGNINRDIRYIELSQEYIELSQSERLKQEQELKKLNQFVVEVVQPVGACMELVRSKTGGIYPINEYVSDMIGLLRQVVENTDQNKNTEQDTWDRFRKEYLRAQVRLVVDIRRQRILVDENPPKNDSPLATCNFVIPILKYPKNPFKSKHWPYGALVLAVLLHAADETEAALTGLASWLDSTKKNDTPAGKAIPEWMKTRAKMYLFELSRESGRDHLFYRTLAEEIRKDIRSQFSIPDTVDDLQRAAINNCKEIDEDLKHILFSFMTYTYHELVAIVRSPTFLQDISLQKEAELLTEYLRTFQRKCFKEKSFDQETIDKWQARFYTIIARTYVALARAEDQAGGHLDPRDEDLLRAAQDMYLRALLIHKKFVDDREAVELMDAPYIERLEVNKKQRLEYDAVRKELHLLRHARARASK